jgi:hypothetical protein
MYKPDNFSLLVSVSKYFCFKQLSASLVLITQTDATLSWIQHPFTIPNA